MKKIFGKRKRDEGQSSEEGSSKHAKQHNGSRERSLPFGTTPYETTITRLPVRMSIDQSGKTQKIATLMRALDDALDEDGIDEITGLIGDDNLNHCLNLRKSLKDKKLNLGSSSISSPAPNRMSMSHDYQNIPKTVSALDLTPWKSSTIPTTLPPLPEILDPTLAASAFIHLGASGGRPNDLSYERLEFVGDAYLYITSSLLISKTFPFNTPGQSSRIREMLVKNITLAQYARQYGFDKRAVLPKHMHYDHNELTKIHGDIFEAYVAAVILSDPENGVVRCSEWLKDLWSMTIAKEIIEEGMHGLGLKMESPMWQLRGQIDDVQIQAPATEKVPLNPKEELMKLIGAKGVKLNYRDAAPEKRDFNLKHPLFTVGVYLDGWGETNKMLGIGTATGKKEAGFKAAQQAMSNKKAMKLYMDKKKVVDAQREMEAKLLAQAEEGT